jgi:hypothetical protein
MLAVSTASNPKLVVRLLGGTLCLPCCLQALRVIGAKRQNLPVSE